jgi:hypothetical protein
MCEGGIKKHSKQPNSFFTVSTVKSSNSVNSRGRGRCAMFVLGAIFAKPSYLEDLTRIAFLKSIGSLTFVNFMKFCQSAPLQKYKSIPVSVGTYYVHDNDSSYTCVFSMFIKYNTSFVNVCDSSCMLTGAWLPTATPQSLSPCGGGGEWGW